MAARWVKISRATMNFLSAFDTSTSEKDIPSAPLEDDESRKQRDRGEEKTEVADDAEQSDNSDHKEKDKSVENVEIEDEDVEIKDEAGALITENKEEDDGIESNKDSKAISSSSRPTTTLVEEEIEQEFDQKSSSPTSSAMEQVSKPRQPNTEKAASSTYQPSQSPRWKWIASFLAVLLLVAVAMLAVIVGRLRNERSGTSDSTSSALLETADVDNTESSSLLVIPDDQQPKSNIRFIPLSTNPFATFMSTVSSCDDCEEEVPLHFTFLWLGKIPVRKIYLSSNGYISIRDTGSTNSGCCGIINVVRADLDPSQNEIGGIWTMPLGEASLNSVGSQQRQNPTFPPDQLVINWENVSFFDGVGTTFVNAQATLHHNGNIDFCWGDGAVEENDIFIAGLTDSSPNSKFPVLGTPFKANGQTEEGTWPTNQCRSFKFNGDGGDNGDDIPTSAPVSIPTPVPPPPSCIPTTGLCASDFSSLMDLIESSEGNEVIAICESGEITTEFPILVRQPGITLCCLGVECLIASSNGRNLEIFAESVVLRGLHFYGGSNDEGGGNVLVEGGGNHWIVNCRFVESKANFYGGHLLVRKAKSVVIFNSTFIDGASGAGGGAIAIEDTAEFYIGSCSFQGNNGPLGGAVFATSLTGSRALYLITNSTFEDNIAEYGGGFLATALGSMPRLILESNKFENNLGGAAAVFHHQEEASISIQKNRGSNNLAHGSSSTSEYCNDFSIYLDVDHFCVNVQQNFTYDYPRQALEPVPPSPAIIPNLGSCPTELVETLQWYELHGIPLVKNVTITLTLQLIGSAEITKLDIQLWAQPSITEPPVSFGPDPPDLVPPRGVFTIRFTVDWGLRLSNDSSMAFRLRSEEFGTMRPDFFRVVGVVVECRQRESFPRPTPSPSFLRPTGGGSLGQCFPTAGRCMKTEAELRRALAGVRMAETVGICGYDPITNQGEPFRIDQRNVTLCCVDAVVCEIRGNGTGRNLIVTGGNSTLQDLVVSNGRADGDGGNVELSAGGHHRIIRCQFENGTAANRGGNVAVTSASSIEILGSSFVNGKSGYEGGGVVLQYLEDITVSNSLFERNVATNEDPGGLGGGLFVDGGESVVLEESKFVENSGYSGGGFFVTSLGSFPSLSVLRCGFERNVATDIAGSGAIVAPKLSSTITIRRNDGVQNIARKCESGFNLWLTEFGNNTQVCVKLTDTYQHPAPAPMLPGPPSPQPTLDDSPEPTIPTPLSDDRICPRNLNELDGWYEATFKNVNQIFVSIVLRNNLETSITSVGVLLVTAPFGEDLTPSFQTKETLQFVDAGGLIGFNFTVDVSQLPNADATLRVFPTSFEYDRMPPSNFDLLSAHFECSPPEQWVEVGQRIGSQYGTQMGRTVSIAGDLLAVAPFYRLNSTEKRSNMTLPVASVLTPRASDGDWVEEFPGGVLYPIKDPFGVVMREPIGTMVSFSKASGLFLAVRYGRLATPAGLQNVGAVQIFSCCIFDTREEWSPIGSVLGGTETESVEFVEMADKESMFVVHVKDADQNRYCRVYSIGDDQALYQLGQDIDLKTNTTRFGFTSAGISFDGRTIVAGVSHTVDGKQFCKAVRTFYYNTSTGEFSQFGQDNINLGVDDCLGHGQHGGYNLALSYTGKYLAMASLSGGEEDEGFIRIFRFTTSPGQSDNDEWQQIGADLSGTTRNGAFGSSMDFSEEQGKIRLAIGTPGYDGRDGVGPASGTLVGKVEIFELEEENWSLVGQLFGTEVMQRFGSSVSMSLDGRRLAVGSSGSQGDGGVQVFDLKL